MRWSAGMLGLVLFAACADSPSALPKDTATLTAPAATVLVGGSMTLSGSVAGGAVWSVNGVPGGNHIVGTISPAGVYTAPDLVPPGNPVSIRIGSAQNPADSDSVTLVITPSSLRGDWVVWQPRVVNITRTEPVSLVVHAPVEVTRVELAPTNGSPIRFRHLRDQLYQLDLEPKPVIAGVLHGHSFAGFIDYYAGEVRISRRNGFVNIREATVPDPAITQLAPDAVASPRVLNVRVLDVPETGVQHELATQRLYQLFPDNYDFVAVVQPVEFFQNRFYRRARNDVDGIGLPLVDAGSHFGSASRLQGVIHYPIAFFYDLGEQAANHEIGHCWINFLADTPLAPGIPHWPVSSVASGVMGISLAGGQGGLYPRSFEPNEDGTYTIVPATDLFSFNDLELYLMGLLPAASVGPHFVFDDQTQFSQPGLTVATGPVTTVTVDDIIAAFGPRDPAYGEAQTEFRVATVVLSVGRLLSPDELAFFEFMAARGEATTPLPYSSGFASGTAKPFFVATGGRGRLSTVLH
jgi:hypothetical protein